jgi:hypothetical protein
MAEESRYYCYEVRISVQSPDDKLERLILTFLVDDFQEIEALEEQSQKSQAKFLVEGYTLKAIRTSDDILALVGELH